MSTSNDSFEIIKQLYDIIMSYEDRHPGTIDRIESENGLDESESQFAAPTDEEPLQESIQAGSDDDADEDSNDWMKAFGNVRQFTSPLQIDEK